MELPKITYECSLVLPENVDRTVTVGEVIPTTSSLNLCPSWLIKAAQRGLDEWLMPIINAFLREKVLPTP